MNFEKGQKVRLVATVEDDSVDEDGDVLLGFNGRHQYVAAEAVEERLKDHKVIVCVEYSHSRRPHLHFFGDTFVFKTAPNHQDIYLFEGNIILADEGGDE